VLSHAAVIIYIYIFKITDAQYQYVVARTKKLAMPQVGVCIQSNYQEVFDPSNPFSPLPFKLPGSRASFFALYLKRLVSVLGYEDRGKNPSVLSLRSREFEKRDENMATSPAGQAEQFKHQFLRYRDKKNSSPVTLIKSSWLHGYGFAKQPIHLHTIN